MAWLLYILTKGSNVSFINDGIQYQAPLLIAVVVIKYAALAISRFKTKKCLFWFNSSFYLLFLAVVIIIDYRTSII